MVATAMRKNALHRIFAAWKETRLSLQQARHQLYAAVARADGPTTEAVFGTWRLLAADTRPLAVAEQRLGGRHRLLTLNHAFQVGLTWLHRKVCTMRSSWELLALWLQFTPIVHKATIATMHFDCGCQLHYA